MALPTKSVTFDPASLVEDWSAEPFTHWWNEIAADPAIATVAFDSAMGGNHLQLRGDSADYGYLLVAPRFFFDPTVPVTASFKWRWLGAGSVRWVGAPYNSYCASITPGTGAGAAAPKVYSGAGSGYAAATGESTLALHSKVGAGLATAAQIPRGASVATLAAGTVADLLVTYTPGASAYLTELVVNGTPTGMVRDSRWAFGSVPPNLAPAEGSEAFHSYPRLHWPAAFAFLGPDQDIGPVTFTGRRVWGAADAFGWAQEWDLGGDYCVWWSEPHNTVEMGGLGISNALDYRSGDLNGNADAPKSSGSWTAKSPRLLPDARWRFKQLWFNAPHGKTNPSHLVMRLRYADTDELVPASLVPENATNLIADAPYRGTWTWPTGESPLDFALVNDTSQQEHASDQVVSLANIPWGRPVYLDVSGSTHAASVKQNARLGGVWIDFKSFDADTTYPTDTTWEVLVPASDTPGVFEAVASSGETAQVEVEAPNVDLSGAAGGQAGASGGLRPSLQGTGAGQAGAAATLTSVLPLTGAAGGEAGATATPSLNYRLVGTAAGVASAAAGVQGGTSPINIVPGRRIDFAAADATSVSIGIPVLRALAGDETSTTIHIFPSGYTGPTVYDVALEGTAAGVAGASAGSVEFVGAAAGVATASGTLTSRQPLAGAAAGQAGASGGLSVAIPTAVALEGTAAGVAGASADLDRGGAFVPSVPYWPMVTERPVVRFAATKGFSFAFPVILGGTEALRTLRNTRTASFTTKRTASLTPKMAPRMA